MARKKMILFDWNGTLINDAEIWHKSISKIFESCGLEPIPLREYVKKWTGLGDYVHVYRSCGINLSQKQLDEIYLAEYQKHLDEIALSPNARKTLIELKDRKIELGIVTAQLRAIFEPIFDRLSLKEHFSEVVVEAWKKNSVISRLCYIKKIPKQNCYYVGDMPSDIRHAKEAGVKSIAYLTGHVPEDLLSDQKPNFLISNLLDLIDITKNV